MPSVNSTVGPAQLPAPVGATDALFADPALDGLIDYFGYWIKWALDAKVATMTKPPCTDSCPVANRFTFDPSSIVTGYNFPALFLWSDKSEIQQRTLVRDMRIRELRLLYVFPQLLALPQVQTWSGLLSTVDATIARACERRSHPGYSYNGSGLNASVFTMFSLLSLHYQGSTEGFMKEISGASIRDAAVAGRPSRANDGAIQKGYPALHAKLQIAEDVFGDTTSAADLANDWIANLETGDNATDTTPILDRYIVAKDGTANG